MVDTNIMHTPIYIEPWETQKNWGSMPKENYTEL